MPASKEIRFPLLAAALTKWIADHKLSYPDFNERIGLPRNSTVSYPWVKGQGRPSRMYYDQLQTSTGIALKPLCGDPSENRGPWTTKPKKNHNAARAKRRAEARALTLPSEAVAEIAAEPVRTGRPASSERPLTFEVIGSGECRIRMDVTLPIGLGARVFRRLMDSGIIPDVKWEDE